MIIGSLTFSQEMEAEFVYGNTELDSFVVDNYVRPFECIENGIEFNINLNFTIDTIGNISDVKVIGIKTIMSKMANGYKSKVEQAEKKARKEALRVIKFTSGLWLPKIIGTKKVIEVKSYLIKVRTPEFINGQLNNILINIGSTKRRSTSIDTPFDNPIKYYNLGVKKINQKKPYIAIKYLKHSISLGNRTKDVFYNLGVAFLFNGEEKNACQSWNRALVLGDKDAQELIEKYCKK